MTANLPHSGPNLPQTGLRLQSTLNADGTLHLALAEAPVAAPGPGQVLVRMEAVPINPSDLMPLLASANPADGRFGQGSAVLQVSAHEASLRAGRFGQPLTVGLEGSGTVIAAGEGAEALEGKAVALLSLAAGSFAQYATVNVTDCAPLPAGLSMQEGADVFCNPMTALAIAETARLEGHSALIQTAAASNLGQMLFKVCQEDGIPLVNVVRRDEQAELLRGLGAEHVCDSSKPTFREDLRRAIDATGATVAFDAIGGGTTVGELLKAMEDVAAAKMGYYSPYGSPGLKSVFIYGHLDRSAMVLDNNEYGLLWDVRYWAMPQTLARVGPERVGEMSQRILAGLKTTFASHFGHEISLAQALERETMIGYASLGTGGKYLINPTL